VKTFVLERQNDYVRIDADRVRVEGGVLIFENGDIFSSELVTAKAPGQWLSVFPAPDDDECTCDHEEDE
jgi:hypothetical protein